MYTVLELLTYLFEGQREEVAGGLFAQVQLLGNLLVGKPLQAVKHKDGALLLGERMEYIRDSAAVLVVEHGFAESGEAYIVHVGDIVLILRFVDAAAENRDELVLDNGEEKRGNARADGIAFLPQHGKRLLHQILRVFGGLGYIEAVGVQARSVLTIDEFKRLAVARAKPCKELFFSHCSPLI